MTDQHPVDLHTDIPHPARIYDFLLGGKTHYPADRLAAESILAVSPDVRTTARANRAFMKRAVRHLAAEHGIRQFLDLGSGLPGAGNVHEVAEEVVDGVRAVYVDIDPIVLVYGDALLRGRAETAVVNADARDVQAVLAEPAVRTVLDLTEPIGLLMVSVAHFFGDDEAHRVVTAYRDALAPGSFLVLSHLTLDDAEPDARTAFGALIAARPTTPPTTPRTIPEIERFFDGFELLTPGVVPVHLWRPDRAAQVPRNSWARGGVGRKPASGATT